MLKYIHYGSKFEKQLSALKKSEKMAIAAAKKAEDIINKMVTNVEAPLSILGKLTKHGEGRIKNCIKFDIGKGYRLVCVKDKAHLFLLYIGTHDDCVTWIEHNRNVTPDPLKKNIITCEIQAHDGKETNDVSEDFFEVDYEDILLKKITEKDLNYVFRGITKVAHKNRLV